MEETKPEEEEKKEEVVENLYPEDCEGNMCIDLDAFIKNEYIIDLVTDFRDRLFTSILENQDGTKSEASTRDSRTLSTIRYEVDEKLETHYPRKDAIKLGLYVERTK